MKPDSTELIEHNVREYSYEIANHEFTKTNLEKRNCTCHPYQIKTVMKIYKALLMHLRNCAHI